MSPTRMYIHQIDKYEVHCPIEDGEHVRELWVEFQKALQIVLKKLDRELGKTAILSGLPELRGVGVKHKGVLYTAFGEGFSVTLLDKEALRKIAKKVQTAD